MLHTWCGGRGLLIPYCRYPTLNSKTTLSPGMVCCAGRWGGCFSMLPCSVALPQKVHPGTEAPGAVFSALLLQLSSQPRRMKQTVPVRA